MAPDKILKKLCDNAPQLVPWAILLFGFSVKGEVIRSLWVWSVFKERSLFDSNSAFIFIFIFDFNRCHLFCLKMKKNRFAPIFRKSTETKIFGSKNYFFFFEKSVFFENWFSTRETIFGAPVIPMPPLRSQKWGQLKYRLKDLASLGGTKFPKCCLCSSWKCIYQLGKYL